MDKAIELLVEMNEFVWARFKKDLEELTVEEANWRPVPEANTINHILRHLRIDAPWHLASIGGLSKPLEPRSLSRQRIRSRWILSGT